MSLIRVRRRRKNDWIEARKGMALGRLMGLLIMVGVLIWYLGSAF